MKNSVSKNYLYNLFYQVFLIIVPFITTPYVARVLMNDGTGQYAFTYSVVTYFTLFASLGFKNYAQREVAKVQDDTENSKIVFWEIIIARFIPVVVSLGAYLALVLSGVFEERYTPLLLILAIEIVAVGFDVTFYFQGIEDFAKIVRRNILVRVLQLVAIFVFVKNENDLWVYVLIQALSAMFSSVSLWVSVPRPFFCRLGEVKLKPLRHLGPAFLLFLPTIAISVYTLLDKTLIGLITKVDSENGNYEYAESIVKLSMTVITSLSTVLIPRNSKEFAVGNLNIIENNVLRSLRFVFWLGLPMVVGMIVVSDNFIPWFLGPGYDKAADLVKILSPLVVIIGLSNVFGLQYLIPCNKDKKYTICIVSGAVVNLILNFSLIPHLMSFGAAIATVVAESVITLMMYWRIRREININSIIAPSLKYVIASVVMFVVCNIIGSYLIPSIINTIIIVFSGIVVYVLLMFILRDSLTVEVINRIKQHKKGV